MIAITNINGVIGTVANETATTTTKIAIAVASIGTTCSTITDNTIGNSSSTITIRTITNSSISILETVVISNNIISVADLLTITMIGMEEEAEVADITITTTICPTSATDTLPTVPKTVNDENASSSNAGVATIPGAAAADLTMEAVATRDTIPTGRMEVNRGHRRNISNSNSSSPLWPRPITCRRGSRR